MLAAALMTTTAGAWAQPCNPDYLKADYQITSQAGDAEQQVKTLSLWRNGNQVAHQFADKQISEIWFLQKNQRVNLTRQFDQYNRGIEYQAMEMRHGQGADWQSKYALISKQMLAALNKDKTFAGKSSCETIEHYSGTVDGAEVNLQWLPKLNLVKQLSISNATGFKQWTLLDSNTEIAEIAEQYRLWGRYQTTDYADIGDNESDPFLLQMINLGHK